MVDARRVVLVLIVAGMLALVGSRTVRGDGASFTLFVAFMAAMTVAAVLCIAMALAGIP